MASKTTSTSGGGGIFGYIYSLITFMVKLCKKTTTLEDKDDGISLLPKVGTIDIL